MDIQHHHEIQGEPQGDVKAEQGSKRDWGGEQGRQGEPPDDTAQEALGKGFNKTHEGVHASAQAKPTVGPR